ncbi:MAG: transcriptional regulator [Cytophagia bacterium]|nr:transcriptional regulator [Cytophagia bacterium]
MISQPSLGKTIREHRKKSGLSQQALAEMVGVGKTVIYDLEKGKDTVKLSTLLRILQGLNISVRLESPFIKNTNE